MVQDVLSVVALVATNNYSPEVKPHKQIVNMLNNDLKVSLSFGSGSTNSSNKAV